MSPQIDWKVAPKRRHPEPRPEPAASYVITSPEQVQYRGAHVATTERDGVTIAHFMDGRGHRSQVPLNVPLCSGCCDALDDGYCADCDAEHDETVCVKPRAIAGGRSLLTDPRALTEAVFAAARTPIHAGAR
jgi:hypothetical protein